MLASLHRNNPKAAAMVLDPSPHVSAICPRRAGKTYAGAMAALITGEAKPGTISLIISLNLKQLRRLYWAGGPSGLQAIARRFNVKLTFNNTFLRWDHENGSFGYLLGADDDEQLEVIRGLEADLYLIDECKSFAPAVLDKLIDDIIDPQRNSRKGRLMLIGTPGFILSGPFYKATCPTAKDADGKPYLVGIDAQYRATDRTDPWGRTPKEDLLWSCHHWTLEDNAAMPHQWEEALKKKRQMKWADTDPTWCREYLGHWAAGGRGLVFRYGEMKQGGRITWHPERTTDNPCGLPPEGAPWRLIAGLDIGYEAPTAFVIAAYSARMRELRHVYDYSRRHMLVDDIAEMIDEAQAKFGRIERIFADVGNLGKMIVQTLEREHGFPLERADKREKQDYIELLNSAFARGEVQIIENTPLEFQLLTNAWKLPDEKEETFNDLARRGKLREDDAIPNDSTDAFLYLYRGSLHHFGIAPTADGPAIGSPEWRVQWEKDQLRKARQRFADEKKQGFFGVNALPRAPAVARRALTNTQWMSTPLSFRPFYR